MMRTCNGRFLNSSKPSSDGLFSLDPFRTIVQDQEGGTILTVHVQPNSSRTECVGIHGDAVKIRVAARPVDGAANDELVRFIAEQCAVPRANIHIRAGMEARRKRLFIKGASARVVLARLLPELGRESL